MSNETYVQQTTEWVKKGPSSANMPKYEKACRDFRWEEVETCFDWHGSGKVNIVHEMIDKHVSLKNDALIFWDPRSQQEKRFSFEDLKKLSSKCANVLNDLGIGKGDRVGVYLPRSPELYVAMLGVHRIGAIPVPLFEAFMTQAVQDRLGDSGARCLITTEDLSTRVPFKELPELKDVLIVGHNYDEEMEKASDVFEPVWLTKDDGLVIHYTSGSTGKSKGVLHRQYAMVGHYQTALWVLDLKPNDIYWCTADPGWVTGTSYGMYGPWLNGITTLVVGGRFNAEHWFKAIERFKVSVWYSAPTAFRMLMGQGDAIPKACNLSSLRHICSVGEPLNPEALRWVQHITGKAPHETWWMTETGMQLICNYPADDFKLGATGKPFPGTYSTVVNDAGEEVPPNTLGNLVVKPGWPSMMHAIWNNQEKYDEYFSIKGWFKTGDSAYKDEDGFIWYAGRGDDVINTSGERIGPFEVESALVHHPAIVEAGVIGKPDPVKGEIIKAYIALSKNHEPTEALKKEITEFVRHNLSAHAAPKEIEFCEKVPKTRSGKIMRRVLRAWDRGEPVGDISTMED